jgi:1,4-dihydroxy-2-naphthoate polyprenyltransferase
VTAGAASSMTPSGAPPSAPEAFRPRPWRAWLLAARVPTLTASVTPVLVGTAAAASAGVFHPFFALAALVVSLSIQLGTNFYNDALDFLRGADTPRRRGPVRVTQSGLLTPRQVLLGAYACFGLAGAVGLYFVALYGWPVLLAGALAIASGLGYTGGPWPIGYHGLGELFVFVFFGVLAVAGSAYVQIGRISPLAVAASVPVGLLATAILVLNNLRDIETDRTAGKRTLAVRMGAPATRALYLGCLTGAAVAPVAIRATGLTGAWFWLPLLMVMWMGALARVVWQPRGAAALNRALKHTAQLHQLFGLLLAASFLL